jgi:hypothetical protein
MPTQGHSNTQISAETFRAATGKANFTDKTLEIAYGVLVEGKRQVDFVHKFGMSKGAVSHCVKAVLARLMGYEFVQVYLPRVRANTAKTWGREFAAKTKNFSR